MTGCLTVCRHQLIPRRLRRGVTLDLLMTCVPDLVRLAVVALIANSGHSSPSVVISTGLTVPNLCFSRKVFLKHQVNWNTVCGAIQDLPWRSTWSADNPIDILNEHLSMLVGRYDQPRSSVGQQV